jgi:hypothetical protein
VVTLDGTRAARACACEPYAERDHLQHLSHCYFHHCVECTRQRRRHGGAFFVVSSGLARGEICALSF